VIEVPDDFVVIASRLMLALFAGGLIGIERSYHGRAAGFRTHTLVCVASSILLLLTDSRIADATEIVRMDPLRTVQGIMTGIGFLGAGVILKEGASIRGLTTAASIWITAAVGIAIGSGTTLLGFASTVATLTVLISFRWIENAFPSQQWAILTVRFPRILRFREESLMNVIRENGVRAKESGYHLEEQGKVLVCQMNVFTGRKGDYFKLAEALRNMEGIQDFNLTITSR
jgi:putative Mg2+ transporter-C (MgtC) family protein